MDNKRVFIQEIDAILSTYDCSLSNEARSYFEALKKSSTKEKTLITENGMKILKFMQEHMDEYSNIFKSKDIGEGLFISSRSVSGSMQKLIKEGFCEKMIGTPVCYSITESGVQQATI